MLEEEDVREGGKENSETIKTTSRSHWVVPGDAQNTCRGEKTIQGERRKWIINFLAFIVTRNDGSDHIKQELK